MEEKSIHERLARLERRQSVFGGFIFLKVVVIGVLILAFLHAMNLVAFIALTIPTLALAMLLRFLNPDVAASIKRARRLEQEHERRVAGSDEAKS